MTRFSAANEISQNRFALTAERAPLSCPTMAGAAACSEKPGLSFTRNSVLFRVGNTHNASVVGSNRSATTVVVFLSKLYLGNPVFGLLSAAVPLA